VAKMEDVDTRVAGIGRRGGSIRMGSGMSACAAHPGKMGHRRGEGAACVGRRRRSCVRTDAGRPVAIVASLAKTFISDICPPKKLKSYRCPILNFILFYVILDHIPIILVNRNIKVCLPFS
jgi:hypothetical protein